MGRVLKTTARVLLSLAFAFVLLELGLRTLALFVGSGEGADQLAPRKDGERVVLCVGDSFTFGMGASERAFSYPAQLERRLQTELGDEWRVVNGGKPGRDSYGVLAELQRQLDTYRPDVLCVLIGANDNWRRRGRMPEQVVDGDQESGLRTVRLFKVLARGIGLFDDEGETESGVDAGTAPVDYAGHPLVGRWRLVPGDLVATFWPDGAGRVGEAVWKWAPDGDALSIQVGDQSMRAVLETVNGAVVLRPEIGEAIALMPADALTDAEVEARRQLVELQQAARSEQYERTVELSRSWLEGGDHDRADRLYVLSLLADAESSLGREKEAQQTLQLLQDAWQETPDQLSCASLAQALSALGDYQGSFDLAKQGLGLPGDSLDRLARPLVFSAQAVLAPEDARAEIRALLERSDRLTSVTMAWLHLQLPVSMRGSERVEAFAMALVRAQKVAPMSEPVRTGCGRARGLGVDPKRVSEHAVEVGLDAESTGELLRELRGEATAASDEWQVVLGEHIERVASVARKSGATVVIVGYPFSQTKLQEAHSSAADRLGVPFVEVASRFPESEEERRDFFVADGHCNDRGYRLMADAVADILIPRLRKD